MTLTAQQSATTTFSVQIRARMMRAYLFFVPFFLLFAGAAVYGMVVMLSKKDGSIVAEVILMLLYLLPVYLGATALVAMAWILWGKEVITVTDQSVRADRSIFKVFSSRTYDRKLIEKIYVNCDDYLFNKVTRGRNDFLAVFKFGTVHFHYNGQLIHIAGGMSDQEGREFVERLQASSVQS